MILKVFTVYDSKAGAYLQPFFTSSIGLAVRSFTEACNTADHNFSRYAEDFTLFELGEFDQNTATFTMLKTPTSLGKAVEFVRVHSVPGQITMAESMNGAPAPRR